MLGFYMISAFLYARLFLVLRFSMIYVFRYVRETFALGAFKWRSNRSLHYALLSLLFRETLLGETDRLYGQCDEFHFLLYEVTPGDTTEHLSLRIGRGTFVNSAI